MCGWFRRFENQSNLLRGSNVSIYLTRATKIVFALALVFLSSFADALPVGANALLTFEQKYVNRDLDSNKILALTNYQAKEFSPELAQTFEVRSYWVPTQSTFVFESRDDSKALGIELMRIKGGISQVLFLVHPESEQFYREFVRGKEHGPVFEATATASSRTLMAWPKGDDTKVFFAKLSLDKKIGGVVRTIPKGEVARSVGTSLILDAARNDLPKNFLYLPEFFGVMPKGMERGGQLFRAMPKAVLSGRTRLMPMFAIYTRPDSKSKSPLEIMIERSGLSAQEVVTDLILQPFAKQWVELVVKQGIAIEAHAQNVLIEVDKNGLPTKTFAYRDFGGFNIDLAFRRLKGLPVPANLPIIESEKVDYHQEHHLKAVKQSLETYFEGGFLFGLGKELQRQGYKYLGYQELMKLFREQIKSEFRASGLEIKDYNFFGDLERAVKAAREQVPVRVGQCSLIF